MVVEKAAEPAAQQVSEDVDMAEGDPNKILFLQRLPHEVRPPSSCTERNSSQFKNNCLAEMCGGSGEGS